MAAVTKGSQINFVTKNEIAIDSSLSVVGTCNPPGDMNGDGILDILDLISIVNTLLNGNYDPCADVNNDGDVNVLDIVALINVILASGCFDVDGDGYDDDACGGDDCNDNVAAINPGVLDDNCDNVDNNCDNQVDENYQSTNCTTGQQGVCSAGTTSCIQGAITCEQDNQPSAEVCDGVDNDCDNQVDENYQSTNCTTGQQGVCSAGTTAVFKGL